MTSKISLQYKIAHSLSSFQSIKKAIFGNLNRTTITLPKIIIDNIASSNKNKKHNVLTITVCLQFDLSAKVVSLFTFHKWYSNYHRQSMMIFSKLSY